MAQHDIVGNGHAANKLSDLHKSHQDFPWRTESKRRERIIGIHKSMDQGIKDDKYPSYAELKGGRVHTAGNLGQHEQPH